MYSLHLASLDGFIVLCINYLAMKDCHKTQKKCAGVDMLSSITLNSGVVILSKFPRHNLAG